MKLNKFLASLMLFSPLSISAVSKDDAITLNVYMAAALSNYYCENGAWPKSLKKLKKFEKKNNVAYSKLSKEKWSYVIKQTSYLNDLEEGAVGYFVNSNDEETKSVLSRHSLPDCKEEDPKQRMQVEIILSDE